PHDRMWAFTRAGLATLTSRPAAWRWPPGRSGRPRPGRGGRPRPRGEGKTEGSASPNGGTNSMNESVFFFRGLDGTRTQMDTWVATAQGQQRQIDFNAFFWSESNKEDKAVTAIKASKADRIFIVGHSSGCANANAVDKKVVDKSLIDRVVLVALDGFAPDPDQRNRSSTQLWGAENGAHKSF